MEKLNARKEQHENTSEFVVFRYRVPLLNAAHEYIHSEQARRNDIEPADGEFFETFLKAVDVEGTEQYDFYFPPEFPEVKIPYTRVSVNEVYERLGGVPSKNREKGPVEKFVLYQGWSISSDVGHPGDQWGEVYRQVSMGLSRMAYAKLRGEPSPDIEIISNGLAHGYTGHATYEWFKAVRERGYEFYGEQWAQQLLDLLKQDSPHKIILHGYSGGSQVAYRTAEALSQKDLPHTKVELRLLNSAGFHERKFIQQLLWALKTPLSVFGEAAGLFLMGLVGKDPLFLEEMKSDRPFREKLASYLGSRFSPASPADKRLNTMISLAEGYHLLKGMPYSTMPVGKITEMQGSLDPAHISLNSLKALRENRDLSIVPQEGSTPRKFRFTKAGHYLDYNDRRVPTLMRQMHAFRKALAVFSQTETH